MCYNKLMTVPGLKEATHVENKVRSMGIHDVQLLYDPQLGMWAVVQVQKRTKILLPKTYNEAGIKPMIMWWVKNDTGAFRMPGETDIHDIVAVVTRAQKSWDMGGDALADEFDKQDAEKDRKHKANFKKKIKAIAPDMKKAIRKGNL